MFRVYGDHTPLVGDSKASCWAYGDVSPPGTAFLHDPARSVQEREMHTGMQLSEIKGVWCLGCMLTIHLLNVGRTFGMSHLSGERIGMS